MSTETWLGDNVSEGIAINSGLYVQYNLYGNIFEVSRKYVPLRPVGRGASGLVCAALNTETGEQVAIKKIGKAFDNIIVAKRTLREIKLHKHMDHDNVVALKDIIRPRQRDNFKDVYIVYELMDTDLHAIIRSNQPLTDAHSRLIGSPDDSSLGFLRSDNTRRYVKQLPQYPRQNFANRFPNMSIEAVDLLQKMLVFDPSRRITVDEALCHPYLAPFHEINEETVCERAFGFDFEQPSLTEGNIKELIYRESIKFNPQDCTE
ncbi:hypothetical protein Bca4012_027350 [Brassica carinata]